MSQRNRSTKRTCSPPFSPRWGSIPTRLMTCRICRRFIEWKRRPQRFARCWREGRRLGHKGIAFVNRGLNLVFLISLLNRHGAVFFRKCLMLNVWFPERCKNRCRNGAEKWKEQKWQKDDWQKDEKGTGTTDLTADITQMNADEGTPICVHRRSISLFRGQKNRNRRKAPENRRKPADEPPYGVR